MKEAAAYVLTVTAAAILVAVLRCLAGQGAMGTLMGLLGGVFMTLTVLSPLLSLELPDPAEWFSAYAAEGEAAAAAGELLANESRGCIIKEETEAYILDKAALYGGVVTAEVALNDDQVPESVTLTGSISSYGREKLTQIITEDLGVEEGAVHWIR